MNNRTISHDLRDNNRLSRLTSEWSWRAHLSAQPVEAARGSFAGDSQQRKARTGAWSRASSLTAVAALTLHFASPANAQTEASRELPLVWVLSTGGTIAGQGASSTSLAEYKSGSLLGEQLVAGVPEIKQVALVKVEQIANVSSQDLTIANWLTIASRINAIFRR